MKAKKIIAEYWYLILSGLFLVFAAGIFISFGEDSYIAIHDNLDLFIPQYQMMKDTGSFWGQGHEVPFLGGISRDNLPAEFSLYTLLYMLMPAYAAYITGYLLKIVIALLSCVLLARDWFQGDYLKYRPIVVLCGLAYGVLNLFPNFGIPFASIPLVIFLFRKIYAAASLKQAGRWYMALVCYPLLSYFSYFGLFILAYLVIAVIWLSLRDKKLCLRLAAAVIVLAAGYILCEYRLFGQMLFSDTVTIRTTMEAGSFTWRESLNAAVSVWAQGMFHAESVHTWLVLPVCGIYFLVLNISYLRSGNGKRIFKEPFNLLALILVFNSAVYGLYYQEGFRRIVEGICPPLTGWQFNRTIFFSPFGWYASFFLVLKRLYDSSGRWWRGYANLLALAGVLVIILAGTRYNDLYHTCYYKAREILKEKVPDQLSYREFYGEDVFTAAREAIDYQGEWSAAYGFYPAVLEYNQVATLDGYLGFYAQEYKEAFRRVIAPALERVPESQSYYDEWGARLNLYSGEYLSVTGGVRNPDVSKDALYWDREAFLALGGRYIFSRLRITNPEEAGLKLRWHRDGEAEQSPYELYVYEVSEE